MPGEAIVAKSVELDDVRGNFAAGSSNDLFLHGGYRAFRNIFHPAAGGADKVMMVP